MRLGISDCQKEDKFNTYVDWIHGVDATVEYEKLSYQSDNASKMSALDGVLLTGGGDIDPALYGSLGSRTLAKGVDKRRDEFEIDIVKRALAADLPILGICRGMQLMNVALGGSLHIDLKFKGFDNHSGSDTKELRHALAIEPNSLLSDLAGGVSAEVNSFHHQAVDHLGSGLNVVAQSPDGVIEAAEWAVKEGSPFLLLVQWHPERTTTHHDFFSMNLARIFLREMKYAIANKTT